MGKVNDYAGLYHSPNRSVQHQLAVLYESLLSIAFRKIDLERKKRSAETAVDQRHIVPLSKTHEC